MSCHANCHAGSTSSGSRQLRAQLDVYSATVAAVLPRLSGQTEASASQNGTIDISDVMLTAAPGSYVINVTLPDYPQVSFLGIPLLTPCFWP